MAYIVIAYIAMTRSSPSPRPVAYIVMVYLVIAYNVIAYLVMAYIVLAYLVMAHIVMAARRVQCPWRI